MFGGMENMPTFAPAIERESKNKRMVRFSLVRIHACHAWGRGFESRPHRNKH